MPRMINKIVRRLRDYGLWPTVLYSGYASYDAYQSWQLGITAAMRASRFFIPHAESRLPGIEYYSHQPTTSYYMFRYVFDHYILPDQRDVFLDWGSGAGRVLLMAGATYPFCRMIGVEYDVQLAAFSRQLIQTSEHRLRCRTVKIINLDARLYEVPPDVTVMYFYNPFGPAIMQAVCQNVRESLIRNPRELRIVCYRPHVFDVSIAGSGWVAKVAELFIPCVSRDSIAVYKTVPERSSRRRVAVTR